MNALNYDFEYAYGKPELEASFKSLPEDFKVIENLGFDFTGSGEHVCMLVEKTGLTTNDVAKALSRQFHIAPREISYAGLKDKQGVTQQWFSLRAGIKRELSVTDFAHPQIQILDCQRNIRKIKRGSHTGNAFIIRLRDLSASFAGLNERLELISKKGVPNYFGSQRFGKNLDNVDQALLMFAGAFKPKERFMRGIYLSAARSWLFNHLLSARVAQQSWDSYVEGDVMALSGSASCFTVDKWDKVLDERLQSFDIHPTGCMWGAGESKVSGLTADNEALLARDYAELCHGLEKYGLKQERRALRLQVENMKISPESDTDLVLEFSLARGTYATSVLRELIVTVSGRGKNSSESKR